MAQKNKGPWWRCYRSQLLHSRYRGIEFLLTFEEWCDIWRESGKWEQRGRRRGQYVMARFGDQGAYERDNVRVCLVGENVVENTSRLDVRGFCVPGYQAKKWREATPRQRAKWRRAQAHMIGKNHTKTTLNKMSDTAMGRRMVVREGKRCWAHPGDQDYPG